MQAAQRLEGLDVAPLPHQPDRALGQEQGAGQVRQRSEGDHRPGDEEPRETPPGRQDHNTGRRRTKSHGLRHEPLMPAQRELVAHQWRHNEHPTHGKAHQARPDQADDATEPGCNPGAQHCQSPHEQAHSPSPQIPGEGAAGEGSQHHRRSDDTEQGQSGTARAGDLNSQRPFQGTEEQTCRPCVQAEAERSGRRAARRMRVHRPVTVYVIGGRYVMSSVGRSAV